jgi:epoxyqueuosine reductase QueG
MTDEAALKEKVEELLYGRGMDVVGVADVADWRSPLAECTPAEILPGCARVIVFGKEIPRPTYTAGRHALDLYGNVAHNYYETMDAAAIDAALMLTREGFASLPLGAYQPLLMREGKYWGIVSLKHSAVRAGIGTMGKNTLLATENFGNRLRLAGLLTTAPLPAGEPLAESLCVTDCRKCVDVCPVHALDGHGNIDQYKCLKRCTAHPLLATSFLSQWFRGSKPLNKYFELVTGSLAARYSYSCFACLVNCPHFKKDSQG